MLSLHLPLIPATKGLIGRDELRLLPAGAVVVNVARGGIIDEDALAELLHSGHLAGAGLDVFETEPLPATSPLLAAPNTLFSPHSASASGRSAQRLSHWTIGDAIEYLASGSVTHGSIVVQVSR
jgi:phosphoglycerate dehydrogenase-like enzyme